MTQFAEANIRQPEPDLWVDAQVKSLLMEALHLLRDPMEGNGAPDGSESTGESSE